MKTLLLSSKDVEAILDQGEVNTEVEKGFLAHGLDKTQMPPKSYVNLQKYAGDMRSMPCYVEDPEALSIKWVNVHPDNPEKGLPTVMATIVYSDPATGFPQAIMDGTIITDMRTGAAGAVSCKYLAREDSQVLGLVGAGVQAQYQLDAITREMDIEEVRVWSRNASHSRRFKEQSDFDNIIVTRQLRATVKGADIIATTTPSREPLVKKDWVEPGTHICAIGADAEGKQELDPDILKNATVIIDEWKQASHSGEINVPLRNGDITKDDVDGELGKVVARKKDGRTTDDEITVFDSTGLAVQDAVTARLAYEKHRGHGEEKQLM